MAIYFPVVGEMLHGSDWGLSMVKNFCTGWFAVAAVMILAARPVVSQQRTRTVVNSDGSREVLDVAAGWTEIDKSGKSTNLPAADLTKVCRDLDELPFLAEEAQNGGIKVACEIWGELQPKTQIEKVPLSRLVTRLLLLTPDSTDFARYRGIQLTSDGDKTTYDATIRPNDVGQDTSCTVEESNHYDKGMYYTYECIVKTSSFPDAVLLKNQMVHDLAFLRLTEDEIAEHGLAAFAKGKNICAPSGECLYAHIFVSAYKDSKSLRINATPDFTMDAGNRALALQIGHALISGISGNSATVSLQIISAGPPKAGTSPSRQ